MLPSHLTACIEFATDQHSASVLLTQPILTSHATLAMLNRTTKSKK